MDKYINFSAEKPIYMQIAERLCDEIVSGCYADDEHTPSVREYSVLLEVNVNTTVKAYEQLVQNGIVYQKRGMGYFVTKGAREQILKVRRKDFLEHQMPEFISRMRQLGVGVEEFNKCYNETQK